MRIEIKDKNAGKRLDTFLKEASVQRLPSSKSHLITRSFAEKLVGSTLVNGKQAKKGYELKIGDLVEVKDSEINVVLEQMSDLLGISTIIKPQKGNLTIVEESSDWLVLNKPKGVVIHPGVGNGANTLANYVVGYLQSKNEYDPHLKRGGVVHRLDKGVSGLVIFAKNRKTQLWLKKQFEERRVFKVYIAKVTPVEEHTFSALKKASVSFPDGVGEGLAKRQWYEVEGLIQRDPANRTRMRFETHSRSGKYALTYISPVSKDKILVLIKTGRMHQIRATLRYVGRVILGDRLYGYKGAPTEGIELEAIILRLAVSKGEIKSWSLVE